MDKVATCQCGKVKVEAIGQPILTASCYCTSCQDAGHRLEQLASAPPVLDADGGTSLILYRKDRVQCVTGRQHLEEHRLKPEVSHPTGRCHVLQLSDAPRLHQGTLGVDLPQPLSDGSAAARDAGHDGAAARRRWASRRRAEPSRSLRQVHAEAGRCLDCDGLPPASGAHPRAVAEACSKMHLVPAPLFGLKTVNSKIVRPDAILISRSRTMPNFSSER